MIDVHCHLEQHDFDKDRDDVVERCKKDVKMKAVITCCAHPDDFKLTVKMVKKYNGFIFATAGIHPEFVKEINEKQKDDFFDLIKENKDSMVAIGEVGLDYWWCKQDEARRKQKDLFADFIQLSKELKLPLVIHARDAFEDAIKILENNDAKHVLMHLFGAKHLVDNVIGNGWHISIGPIIKASKNHKKIVRDSPLERVMLETDSPWFGSGGRCEPTAIRHVAEKIAEVKKISFGQVWKTCGENAARFFNLPMSL